MSGQDGLADLFAEHVDLTDRTATDGCSCGQAPDPSKYEAHLAAVVRDYLTSDEVVERAAKAIGPSSAWRATARAALAAATEAEG